MTHDDAMFWERLLDMPAVEAEQECVLRREQNCLQMAVLTGEMAKVQAEHRGGWQTEMANLRAGLTDLQSQLTKLNERIRELRQLQHRISWRNAVMALYGEDGVAACLVWMEQNGQLPGKVAAC